MSTNKPESKSYVPRLRGDVSSARPDFSKEFQAAIETIENPYDVKATLICRKKPDAPSEWNLSLTDICGNKTQYLFGHAFDTHDVLSLNDIIPLDLHESHNAKVNSVLNEGKSSPYWDRLFNTMMKRTIPLVTHGSKLPRSVKILMALDEDLSREREFYVFKITLFDQTIQHAIAEKAGSITHDLRGLLTACMIIQSPFDTLSPEQLYALSKEELVALHAIHLEAVNDRKQMLSACLDLCKPSRSDFTAQAIMDDNRLDNIELEPLNQLADFLTKLPLEKQVGHHHDCAISCSDIPSVTLEKNKIESLKRLLVNLIKNAIEATATEISVIFAEEVEQVVCQVTDNGKGMSRDFADSFFSRPLPEQRTEIGDTPVTSNRHEGTLLAFKAWQRLGGQAAVTSPKPAQFTLSIPKPHHFFAPLPRSPRITSLSSDQLIKLEQFFSNPAYQYTLLLIDDSLLQLKSLTQKIHRYLSVPFSEASILRQKTRWSKEGILFDTIGACGVIYAEDGRIALDIIKQGYSPTALITDNNMPNLTGIQLLHEIGRLNADSSGNGAKMLLALHTSDEESDLDAEAQTILRTLNVMCLTKAHSRKIDEFLTMIFHYEYASPPVIRHQTV